MARLAGGQFTARETSGALLAMHADGLFLDNIGVAGCAVHGIKSASVPPLVSTDMALEALNAAMRRQAEVTGVVVAFEAGIRVFCCAERGG